MPFFVSNERLETIKSTAARDGARQARIEDFLEYVAGANARWSGHGVNIYDIVGNIARDIDKIIDSKSQAWYRDWLDPWWEVAVRHDLGVVIKTTRDGRLVPFDRVIAWHLYQVPITKIVIDAQAASFYVGDKLFLTAFDGALAHHDRRSYSQAVQLLGSYADLFPNRLELSRAGVSSIVATKSGDGTWSYTAS